MILNYDNLPDVIWAEMYGRNRTNPDAVILEIKKNELHKSKDGEGFIYIWGWPGPDCNYYAFKDYGETWAFTPEELFPARKYEDVYG